MSFDDKTVSPSASHAERAVPHKMSPAEIADAQRAALAEHRLGFAEAFQKYKKATIWSVIVSMTIVMESYDTILLGSFYAYPTFQKKFGDQIGANSYSVPAQWQSALGMGANIGIVIGIFANGFLIDKFGHKPVILVSLVVLTGFIALTFAATSRGMLLAGQILCGLPWGTLNTIAPSYAIETAPLALRHYTPTFVNLCWVIGHLIGAGVLDGLVNNTTEWGWRLPFALQWMFPLPLFALILFAPASPWWLVRKGKQEEAVEALNRLSDPSVDNTQVAALMRHTVELEAKLNFGNTYWDCFRGVDLRRTEIACISWIAQALVGFSLQGNNAYFFELAGLASTDAFKLNLGVYALAFLGTTISLPLQSWFGRRTIWLAGLVAMFVPMILIGILACVTQSSGIKWAQAVLLLVWFFMYGWSFGPLPYVICSEIGSAQLRSKTISLSRNAYYIISIVNTVAAPYMLNPTKGNLKGKAAFVPAAFILIIFVWSWWRFPETKGRSFEEIDIMFARNVPAREFGSYVIHPADEFDGAAEERKSNSEQ